MFVILVDLFTAAAAEAGRIIPDALLQWRHAMLAPVGSGLSLCGALTRQYAACLQQRWTQGPGLPLCAFIITTRGMQWMKLRMQQQ